MAKAFGSFALEAQPRHVAKDFSSWNRKKYSAEDVDKVDESKYCDNHELAAHYYHNNKTKNDQKGKKSER